MRADDEFNDDRVTTPPSCAEYNHRDSVLTEDDKRRVIEADPNGGRCLVTNYTFTLQYCHCIARKKYHDEKLVSVY
jgi:hypothetical protein